MRITLVLWLVLITTVWNLFARLGRAGILGRDSEVCGLARAVYIVVTGGLVGCVWGRHRWLPSGAG